MKLSISSQEDRQIVTIEEARLDAAIATAFKDRMREILPQAGAGIILDLSQVNFMDSSGLGAVIAVLKAMPEGRELQLAGLTPNVERVFRLTHMNSVFKIIGQAGNGTDGRLIDGRSSVGAPDAASPPENRPG
ncbi:STAS domain-containing protein [Paracoccus cavernae]|uniref:STAS domain-containing protein n=1 Tax=Paracoccus cavernae TaxID=1571207 RepID=UPI0035F24251